MIGLKRFIRPGFVISFVGHVGVLVLGLLLVALGSMMSKPTEPPPKPPDAMVVDIVPPPEPPQPEAPQPEAPQPESVSAPVLPDQAPRPEGTYSDRQTSGTPVTSKPDSEHPAVQPQPPKPQPPQQQQSQQRSTPQRDAGRASTQATLPPLPQSETAQVPVAQPDPAKTQTSEAPPQPDAEETPDPPEAIENFARLALLGGRLGSGFEAPAAGGTGADKDFTLQFRERVSSCSVLPLGISPHDRVAISVHVSLSLDGTLAQPPRPNGPIRSPEEQALMDSATRALERCQPYTMLPADKYRVWKALDLIFSPLTFPGG
jgi:hypothetical protein